MPPKKQKLLELDGRTGEGGGQLVRIACALAAVTSQPVRIHHVRGNRPGSRGGGLKSQHVTSIQWLADASGAQVDGLEVGSQTLEFWPSTPPTALWKQQQQEGQPRRIRIAADSGAASALLVFQAVFPFLLFAGSGSEGGNDEEIEKEEGQEEEPIELEIHGGTNVSFSPSYEYLDQVLLPALQAHFGVCVERRLERRRWSQGSSSQPKGAVWFRFRPLRPGQTLKLCSSPLPLVTEAEAKIQRIDVSVLAPAAVRAPLESAVARDLEARFPGAEVRVVVGEDSGHASRLYALVVAHSETEGVRWGCDWLYDRTTKRKTPEQLGAEIARRVCADLAAEIYRGSVVDEHLQDQLVVFQALAEDRTSFPRPQSSSAADLLEPAMERLGVVGGGRGGEEEEEEEEEEGQREVRMRRDRKTDEPFGEGSMHTRTARWVASELLPAVRWFNDGSVCEGAGLRFDR
ncbi:hypothetical protein SLS62_008019 [Diatrype stigma]|uniref:RNA 3'-terminal phosphate cyclase domain-containing protein n=1 Tax=Diatrype stigma TaxID=117547 RepID=A0AAN9UNR2_9PEZI